MKKIQKLISRVQNFFILIWNKLSGKPVSKVQIDPIEKLKNNVIREIELRTSPIDPQIKNAIDICTSNAILEFTTSRRMRGEILGKDTFDTFLGSQLSIGAVILSQSVLKNLGSIQPIDRRVSAIQYLDVSGKKDVNGGSTVSLSLQSRSVVAEDSRLKTQFSLASAVDFDKVHSIDIESAMIPVIAKELLSLIDSLGISTVVKATNGDGAAPTPGEFNAKITDEQEWVFKKYQFLDYVKAASDSIFQKSKRAKATFIICGTFGRRILLQMAEFTATKNEDLFGPYVLGTLSIPEGDNLVVICDSNLDPGAIIFGYKSENPLMSGFIFSPYIPVFSTPTLTLSDYTNQKEFMTANAFTVVQPQFFCAGKIIM